MLELKRIISWRKAQQEVINKYITLPFAWGSADCAYGYAGEHVFAITGQDFRTPFGTYDSAFGALRALKEQGYESLLDFCQKNFPEHVNDEGPTPHMARNGDLMLAEAPETGYALGVCLDERAGFMGPAGFGTMQRDDPRIKYAFKVG